ncbi:MAG: Rpn family recombination-promoting nuclease/putative transposase, partial [Verrucomicrobiales bacterium]|nr:Rpn family recombination-promoting nuclease/putative transposase [Verrucomicrobiales bacterium]
MTPEDSLHHGHDKLFKLGFSHPVDAAAFLRWRLAPALADSVDWDALRLEPGSFIDSQFRNSESDLLFSAPFRYSSASDEPGCLFYFLLEHFSSLPSFPGLQLLRYMLRIWDDRIAAGRKAGRTPAKLPPIVPVV